MHTLSNYQFRILSLVGSLILGATAGYAQNDLEYWNTNQLQLSLSERLDIQAGHTIAYNLSKHFRNEFNQSTIRVRYDVTKRFSATAGFILGSFSLTEGSNRLLVRGTYKSRIADALTWSNALQAEVHSAKEYRYKYRLIYITRLAPRRRFDFLHLYPSVSYSLFYNIGGKPIQYYDAGGKPLQKNTPDGFHRGRLSFNLNSKINRYISFTLYYMMQREFNFLSGEHNKMNIPHPVKNSTIRPFNNYNVIGSTLAISFDLYKKNRKK